MTFRFSYSTQFALDFEQFPEEQQNAVLDFLEIYEQYGLSDFSRYAGKISYSWRNLEPSDANYIFTKTNHLWHYHLGDFKPPKYVLSRSGLYYTSNRLLHFQWQQGSDFIILVDVLEHYKYDKSFWLPTPTQIL